MTAEPLEISSSATAMSSTSLDGLRHLFSAMNDQAHEGPVESSNSPCTEVATTIVIAEVSDGTDADVAQAEARDISDQAVDQTSKITVEDIVTHDSEQQLIDTSKVSRTDLVNVLESFVNLIKNTDDLAETREPQNSLSFEPPQPTKIHAVTIDDKTAEVEELRCLLVEAQETIIRLLTERVEDRAKMAALETELKLLPDLQHQADRALAVAINTDDFRKELTKVKFELERVRLSKVRSDIQRNKRSWWAGVRGWFFKTRDNMTNADPES